MSCLWRLFQGFLLLEISFKLILGSPGEDLADFFTLIGLLALGIFPKKKVGLKLKSLERGVLPCVFWRSGWKGGSTVREVRKVQNQS